MLGAVVFRIGDFNLLFVAGFHADHVFVEGGEGSFVSEGERDLFFVDRLVDTVEAFEFDEHVIAAGGRAGIFVDEFGLLLLEREEALVDETVFDHGLEVGDRQAPVVVFEFELGRHFKLGLEPEGFVRLPLEIDHVGLADHFELFGLRVLMKSLGDDGFEDILADLVLEPLADERGRHLAGAKTGDLDLGADLLHRLVRFVRKGEQRDGQFNFVLATFE